jgi:outer membrane biosynthesis protein TonB
LMRSLSKFIIISLICHAGLVLAMLDVRFSGKLPDSSEVYEVSIVAGMPPAAGASQGVSIPQGKKYIAPKKAEKVSLGEVKKEKATKESSPSLSPSDIKPEVPEESQDMPYAGNLIKPQGQAAAGTGQAHGPAGGTSSEIALWKTKVRGMVEGLWKTPPEIENMDARLQTTYLLRVSRTGGLLQKKLLVSSGNVPFDRSILIALGRASRFPPPPLILVAGEDWVEVTMSFTPPKGAH